MDIVSHGIKRTETADVSLTVKLNKHNLRTYRDISQGLPWLLEPSSSATGSMTALLFEGASVFTGVLVLRRDSWSGRLRALTGLEDGGCRSKSRGVVGAQLLRLLLRVQLLRVLLLRVLLLIVRLRVLLLRVLLWIVLLLGILLCPTPLIMSLTIFSSNT